MWDLANLESEEVSTLLLDNQYRSLRKAEKCFLRPLTD